MNWDMILTFFILFVTIGMFIWDKLRIDVVAMLALLALVLTGIINTKQAVAGFANTTVIMIAALFVVGAGLFKTGVADWLGDRLLSMADSSRNKLLIMLMFGTALLSAFLSNTGTVAVLLPAVVAAAWRIQSRPSKLLLPMAFAAQIGGLLTLIGTPPNIVIANTLKDAGLRPFGFFEFSLIGIPLLIVGVAYMLLVGKRWLPDRKTKEGPPDVTFSPLDLASTYHLDDKMFKVRVRRRSRLVGQTLLQTRFGQDYAVTVVKVERASNGKSEPLPQRALHTITDTFKINPQIQEDMLPGPDTAIQTDDVLWLEGKRDSIQRLALHYDLGIQPFAATEDSSKSWLLSQEIGVAEIVLPPRSALIGRTITNAHFAEKYNVRVLGIARRGVSIDDKPLNNIKLTFGDALLVHGTWQAIGILEKEMRNFVVVGQPTTMPRPTGLSAKAVIALAALVGMLVLMVTGVVSTVIAVLITAMVMVLGGCLSMEQAYRSINWESVVLIAAMLPMSTALQVTGGAEFIANRLVETFDAWHPLVLLAIMFLLTAGFTQVISNTATTVLVAPIAIQTAVATGIAPHPIMMMVAVGASTAFLTPIASPVNTLVLTPGGYRFGDFMKTGLPLLILFMIISIILVPLIWPL